MFNKNFGAISNHIILIKIILNKIDVYNFFFQKLMFSITFFSLSAFLHILIMLRFQRYDL